MRIFSGPSAWAVAALAVLQLANAAQSMSAPAAGGKVAAIEHVFLTRAGEGARGTKVFYRNSCYASESAGRTGGAGMAHDSEVGCALGTAFADVFAQADMLMASAGRAPGEGSRAGGRPRTMPGGEETSVTLVLADGSRRAAIGPDDAAQRRRLLDGLPPPPTWYAEPPQPPVGKGPQLIVLSARAGSTHLQASLAASGSWWCHRSVVSDRSGDPKPPGAAPKALRADEAAAILARVLAGVSPAADGKGSFSTKRGEISVEAAVAGGKRSPISSRQDAESAVSRFGAEMRRLSASCIPPT
jgi:hypothetical protein